MNVSSGSGLNTGQCARFQSYAAQFTGVKTDLTESGVGYFSNAEMAVMEGAADQFAADQTIGADITVMKFARSKAAVFQQAF